MTTPEDVLKSLKINPDTVIPGNVWTPDELTRESIIEAKLLSRTKSGQYNVDSVNKFIRKASSSISFYHDLLDQKNKEIVIVAEETAALLIQNSNLTLDHQLMQNQTVDVASYDIALKKIAELEEKLRAQDHIIGERNNSFETDVVAPIIDPIIDHTIPTEVDNSDDIGYRDVDDFDLDVDVNEVEEFSQQTIIPADDFELPNEASRLEEEEIPEENYAFDIDIDLSLEDEGDNNQFSSGDPFDGLDLDLDLEDNDDDAIFGVLGDFSETEITAEEAAKSGIPLNRKMVKNIDTSGPIDFTMKTNVIKEDL